MRGLPATPERNSTSFFSVTSWYFVGDWYMSSWPFSTRLKEQFEKEKREAAKAREAEMSKPLEGEAFDSAIAGLKDKFGGGRLF